MWLNSAFLICCIIASALTKENIITEARPGHEYVDIRSSIGQSRALPVEDFITSHKIPESLSVPNNNETEDTKNRVKIMQDVVQKIQKMETKVQGIGNVEQNLDPMNTEDTGELNSNSKRQARVELENFSNTGVIQEDGIRKLDTLRTQEDYEKDDVIEGVQVSSEYPTTMRPILTTPREYSRSSFDFVPVNIIREDSKESWTPFSNRNFDDLGDVSLVPAGSSSRIQVKKGPNGKDYEYEYVYYYYDEEDESKASASNNNQEGVRSTTPPKRGSSTNNRNRYTSVDRPSTVEPATNEIIPKSGSRGRQLGESEEVSEERLPTNTRFPPRSRSNHNTGTTEPTRARGNRPRPNLDLVDSSSFRTHQEGPEFPQTLPKGPVRFLGVTPNENVEDRPTRIRGRPQKTHEPAPVSETVDDIVSSQRRRPIHEPIIEAEFNHGQPVRRVEEEPETLSQTEQREEKPTATNDKYHSETASEGTTIEVPTTEYPSPMDKVALDLYAFLQQGQSNLVDSATDSDDSSESTTLTEDEVNTELPTTTESVISTTTEAITTTEATTTTITTTTTTTTEAPTTTTQAPPGRGKFRRPGVPGGSGTRNRFKSNGPATTSTETSPVEPTQKSRSRFGTSNGFKRPRPGGKQPVHEEEAQKDHSDGANAEKPVNGRNRYRGSGSKAAISTTSAPATSPLVSISSSGGSSRPSFNKININRRRGRPTTVAPKPSEETHDAEESEVTPEGATTTIKSPLRPRLPGGGARSPRPGARVNIRRPGQSASTTTTPAPEVPEETVDEPAGEGTEEETHETLAETGPPSRHTTMNPLDKLRSRNRLQVQPKTTTRSSVSNTIRRSPLLPRRRTTEAPVVETSQEELSDESSETSADSEVTEAVIPETSTAVSTKHEEARGLNALLSSRRRLAPRRPGQVFNRE